MKISRHGVNTWSQPALFGRSAVAVQLLALVDPEDETVVFLVESKEAPGQKLIALWSSSPQPLERYIDSMHEAHKEFLSQLWDASGPFA